MLDAQLYREYTFHSILVFGIESKKITFGPPPPNLKMLLVSEMKEGEDDVKMMNNNLWSGEEEGNDENESVGNNFLHKQPASSEII